MDTYDDDERDVILDALELWKRHAVATYDVEDLERYTAAVARILDRIDPDPTAD